MTDITLKIEGAAYGGWKTVQLTRSIEQFAQTFRVGFSESWSQQEEPIPILEGQAVAIEVDGETILNGFVENNQIDYSDDNHTMSVEGRSKTGDLVDSAAIYRTGQWQNTGLLAIARDLLTDYDITASSETNLGGKFKEFAIQDSETIFECLDRAARMKGVLQATDPDGNLLFTRASRTTLTTVLERGVNILSGSRRGDFRDRHSRYIVKTQVRGTDEFFGKDASGISRVSVDSDVARERPLILMAEGQETGAELQKRADWERNVRAGRSRRLTYTVQDWTNDQGVWDANKLVRVKDSFLRVDETLLITTAQLLRSNEQGTITRLELTNKEAFDVEPLPPKKPDNEWI